MTDQELAQTLRTAGETESNIALAILLKMASERILKLIRG